MTTPIDRIGRVVGACIILVGLAAGMSNVNLFSLNSMYASRLTRCYLGASRPRRDWEVRGPDWRPGLGGAPTAVRGPVRWKNPVTGFDPADDIELWRLKIGPEPVAVGPGPQPITDYLGPHLIMNTALNLVAGEELAWQDREAESFVLTPTHAGSKGTGYAATTPQTGRELTLGRAMSISGAAVDSNIGIHQSSALIALMTALNARLGWWIKNPNPSTWRPGWLPTRGDQPAWDAASPSLALPLLMEFLGQTDETRKWIHISDGGHFENLGVYELIRRRCRYIVCCDAGTDPQASDDNLANMIRLCRTDFGVRIEIDTSPFVRQGPDGLSRWHCVVGKIRYDDVDGGERPGILVLLRTSMTGDEPPDVQEYASKHPAFPRESTLDQFFKEPQFESYRALGVHVVRVAFKDALDDVNNAEPLWSNHDPEIEFKRGNQRLFSAVRRRWALSPSAREDASAPAARSWDRFQRALRSEEDLAPLSRAIYPELKAMASSGLDVPQWHAVAQMIEAMEDAWAALPRVDSYDQPMNRGWIAVFRRWTTAPTLRRLWPILRGIQPGLHQVLRDPARARGADRGRPAFPAGSGVLRGLPDAHRRRVRARVAPREGPGRPAPRRGAELARLDRPAPDPADHPGPARGRRGRGLSGQGGLRDRLRRPHLARRPGSRRAVAVRALRLDPPRPSGIGDREPMRPRDPDRLPPGPAKRPGAAHVHDPDPIPGPAVGARG